MSLKTERDNYKQLHLQTALAAPPCSTRSLLPPPLFFVTIPGNLQIKSPPPLPLLTNPTHIMHTADCECVVLDNKQATGTMQVRSSTNV